MLKNNHIKMCIGIVLFLIANCFPFKDTCWANEAWLEMEKLTAFDGAENDWFGCPVASGWDDVIVGVYKDDDAGDNSGSAYIFNWNGATWSLQNKVTASDAAAGDYFGFSVSIDLDYAIIGAPYEDAKGDASGSAYIFKRTGSSWSQQAKLTAADGAALDWFGYSVAICGEYAVVGALFGDGNENGSGAAYIFKRNGTSWSQQAKLSASDGEDGDQFGCSVAWDGDYIVIGARYDNDNGNHSGSAYVFKQDATGWAEQQKLLASDGAANDEFGFSVSISAKYAIVGTTKGDGNEVDSGAAYIFERDCTNWMQRSKVTASDGVANDWFGRAVSISGIYTVVGAWSNDANGADSGSAYIFERDRKGWFERSKLVASDSAAGDYLGYAVSIGNNFLVCGAMGDDDVASAAGAVYVFEKTLCPVADLSGNCYADFYDLAIFADDWLQDGITCQSGYADCDNVNANGCETNVYSDVDNCGACGNICSLPNAQEACVGGNCVISSCDFGFVDCDGWSTNGCEVNLNDGGGTCATAEDIGGVCGDENICRTGPSRSGRGEKWYKLDVWECETGPGFPSVDPSYDLYVDVQLQSPTGMNYDLYLYEPCGNLIDSSTNGVGQLDQVSYNWSDISYLDMSKVFYIEVRYASGSSCENWDLDTYGGCTP